MKRNIAKKVARRKRRVLKRLERARPTLIKTRLSFTLRSASTEVSNTCSPKLLAGLLLEEGVKSVAAPADRIDSLASVVHNP